MKNKRLTIAGMQIYFDDAGAPLFGGREKERGAVELELAEYRDFIDRWIDASEEARPHRLTFEEQQFRKVLNGIAKSLKAIQHRFDRGTIEAVLREAVKRRTIFPDLTPVQIEASIGDVMSSL
ncbi:MAG: hypothetical protein ABSG26_15770 [Bryobacteraceae bacterium]|jgi:hypothetical protein